MEIYLKELEEDEKAYVKRTVYDKLDAIRKRIALRVISKFLIPYIRMRRSKKKKNKNKKKKKGNKF